MTAPPAAILDIDGTLVDTNYHHAVAWFRAFRRLDVTLPLYRIHRHIGMGGDQLVGALAGDELERAHGDEVRAPEGDLYGELMEEVQPLAGARELLPALKERGHAVVLASSAKRHEVEHYVMVGGSTWDCEAAKRAGVASVGVLTGGFSEQELCEAGAACVFERLDDLHHQLDETPLSTV